MRGPQPPRALLTALRVSQPTLWRALRALGDQVVSFGAARSIQYTLRDPARQELQAPIYRVSATGQLRELGTLIPVFPEGFVMAQTDGRRLHTEGLPWWLFDMRPQGYLGRAYNNQYGAEMGLPARLNDWADSHVLRALLRQGRDLPGNLLVGNIAREQFVNGAAPQPVRCDDKARAYVELAAAAARGEHHGSSAAGEQPKFTAYADLEDGTAPAHVIVKFTASSDNAVSQRWRDLLQAEHLALQALRDHDMPAAQTALFDHNGQRFLEVVRFDREGPLGRRALFSLTALDAEFVGSGAAWPSAVRGLADEGIVQRGAVPLTETLWAFGALIGNTDMHGGNLSFMAEHGRPYELALAYDMTPMAFAPGSGGELPARQLNLTISSEVPGEAWRRALPMAQDFVGRLQECAGLSAGFQPCLASLESHVQEAARRIRRLAPAPAAQAATQA